jgi:hypothetical protein
MKKEKPALPEQTFWINAGFIALIVGASMRLLSGQRCPLKTEES